MSQLPTTSFQDPNDPLDLWDAPDPTRDNYYMVKLHHAARGEVMFFDIHATGGSDAMTGAETLNPGWKAEWAHHQWQNRGVFFPQGPGGF